MLKLDIDRISKKAVRFLISLEKPYWIRAGNKGINLKKECVCSQINSMGVNFNQGEFSCYDCWLYLKDDRNRLKLNRQQESKGLSHNILWDIKRGIEKPDVWHFIESEQDIDCFLRQFTGYY